MDVKNGQITHTILIMTNKTTVPPVLRVTLKEIGTGLPLGKLFRSIGGVQWPTRGSVDDNGIAKSDAQDDLRYKHTYGRLNAPDPSMVDVSVPYEYLHVNYRSTFWLYCTFFLVPVMISWYYLVIHMPHYQASPFVITAVLVRAPILLIAIYGSVWLYIAAQISLIMSHLIRSGKALPRDRYSFALAI